MIDERRQAPRFSVVLCVSSLHNREFLGTIKDFSRKGMRVVLNTPDIKEKEEIQIGIQQPDFNELIPTTSYVAWKKLCEGKCEAGLKFKKFPVGAKTDLLDYSYRKWLKGKLHS